MNLRPLFFVGCLAAGGFAFSSAVLAANESCESIQAKYRGNVFWCEQMLGKCARGAEEAAERRGKPMDADDTPEGKVCNRDYDACMARSQASRDKALELAKCPR